jgi:hypothetical protein
MTRSAATAALIPSPTGAIAAAASSERKVEATPGIEPGYTVLQTVA